MSAPSGLPTFRGVGGLYEGRDVMQLATPEGFAEDPELVWRWYGERIEMLLGVQPNVGHHALAEWARRADQVVVVTSNVDDLHEKAGQPELYKLHGRILEARCTACGATRTLDQKPEGLPRCTCDALMRPNVVWFGERPWIDAIEAAVRGLGWADVVLEVGVSGAVTYGFTEMALDQQIPVIRINPEESPLEEWCEEVIRESADVALPELLGRLD